MTTHRIARHNEVISSAEAWGIKQPPPRPNFCDPSKAPTANEVYDAIREGARPKGNLPGPHFTQADVIAMAQTSAAAASQPQDHEAVLAVRTAQAAQAAQVAAQVAALSGALADLVARVDVLEGGGA